jgi:hypothetical protein
MKSLSFSKGILLITIALFSNFISAQEKFYRISGRLFPDMDSFRGVITKETMPNTDGATIRLISGKDTLYTVSFANKFSFDKIAAGKIKMTITHINYQTIDTLIDLKKNLVFFLSLKEKVNTLNEITVKGSVPLITRSGDTLKFNAAAVKLMEGDVALEILKKMPGVEISENGIKVYGKDIERTYVNSKLIFGKEKMTALENLPASEVVSINTYDEHKDPDMKYHSKNEEKVRVLDIKTKNPIFGANVVKALLSAGHDNDIKGKNRYAAGAGTSLYSEKFIFNLQFLRNNINRNSLEPEEALMVRSSPSYNEQTSFNSGIDATFDKKLGLDKIQVSGNFEYTKRDTKSRNISQRIYLPSEDYERRETTDTSSNTALTSSAAAELNINLIKNSLFNLYINNSYQTDNTDNSDYRSGINIMNSNYLYNYSKGYSSTDNYKYSESIFLTIQKEKISFRVNQNYSTGNNRGEGFRIDSLASNGLRNVIQSGPEGFNRNLNFDGSFSLINDDSKLFIMSIGFRYNNQFNKSRKYVTDVTDLINPYLDSVKSYNFTNDNNTGNIRFMAGIKLPFDLQMNASLCYSTSDLNRDENIPQDINYSRRQYALLPEISIMKESGGMSNFQFSYRSSNSIPSVEQWRNYLNTDNPYMLSAGNPELKQSFTDQINISGSFEGKKNKTYMFICGIDFTRNKIANKTTFFSSDTPLSDWGNYVATAQSTLSTYENLNGSINGKFTLSMASPLKAIKSTANLSVRYNYVRDPSYVKDKVVISTSHSPQFVIQLSSNFSKSFRISTMSTYRYSNTKNTLGQESNFNQVTSRIWSNLMFLKRFYINPSYELNFTSQNSTRMSTVTQHNLNVLAGIKFFKGKADLSVALYDILNKNKGYQSLMTDDYIYNRWNYSYGRFFTFNFTYKLFKARSNFKMPSINQLFYNGKNDAVFIIR